MSAVEICLIVAAVLIGTVLQRVSGTGVGLVVAPVLTILIGPGLGVLVTNLATLVSGFLIMLAVWSRIDWRRYSLVGPIAILGALPGAWVVGQLSAGWLSIILGGLVMVALALTLGSRRLPVWDSKGSGLLGGLIGGFFNTTSGVAGPVMVVYARLSRWPQMNFAATMQPIFVTMGTASVVSKLWMGSVEDIADGWAVFGGLAAIIVLTVGAGILLGAITARLIAPETARGVALTLAGLGAAGAIVRGILQIAA